MCCAPSFWPGHGTPARTQFAAQGAQVDESERRCGGHHDGGGRHPLVPVRIVALEPEQQVEPAPTGKAFRTRRTCTVLSWSMAPGCFN